ncbi:2-keto-4-pentenoate hydratase/2-oxohepta-3-ene-1,7-dioic acid hydratase (catechol pathway) [Pseudomonas citronellolis]|uniref:2-keto-4-pentenoate hydratase/2-oxohepta-3-ene-1,7-dioic acid hydratase (Catechol pathway) n=1 Tax=Pseudomonas citronellolis TaxID=53408 RepID=A0AAQ1KK47_9PSED|nr:fumarylacetoacetate hydrolase family protein [Pseudomonas citronellolis]MCP1645978.1 2-keto-4-pentenoate hydratase/2-oxohepta-3-ene-1,7-dioic acid hydratase in catechol pathway [Pseudomonas citronellolis]MCP1668960.1 2-keto-4-pentenoate hydratase/2-oxohepta-3-ene-1,7-dioic acid hydratase in catechol pathway [Pseudomonas citronellolis]MCP1700324.1 2-keto-4-pentenoate hydratase/2-oxohepta-3-ene-1,7-dioic acid hydratase in catechol pathway [Pseudomonas citronellolis]MCP1706628.1 2-keto-4-penten
MRYVRFTHQGRPVLGVRTAEGVRVLGEESLESLLERGVDLATYGAEAQGPLVQIGEQDYLPLMKKPGKIVCVGLNYADHTKESPYAQPDYPTLFPRFNSSLIAHNKPLVRPRVSDTLDYEGEMAVVLKSGGRHIAKEQALQHVAGYALFNEGSVREYQFKSPQWTVGKNFDDTGAFGPDLVTADELPAGGKGLLLQTRVNGKVVQSANTEDMLFDVATIISTLSEAVTLEAGDVIVSGTPAGVGFGMDPKVYLKAGDVVEVSIEGIGTLVNPVLDEA